VRIEGLEMYVKCDHELSRLTDTDVTQWAVGQLSLANNVKMTLALMSAGLRMILRTF
jgi:hypothetical protein